MKLKFQPFETVIMQSIHHGQGFFRTGATILSIIESADAFDRSIIEYKHLKEALPKFLTSDLIIFKKNRIYLTRKYRQFRKNCKKENNSIEFETELIAIIFDNLEKEKFEKLIQIPTKFLTEEKWNIAYVEYGKK